MNVRQYCKNTIVCQLFIISCFTGICLSEEISRDEEISLIWPVESKAEEPVFDNYKPNMIQYPPAPDGFNISPMEISGAFSPRKHRIYIYADSRYYYVLLRAPLRLSTVKKYGFRIDGRTGEGYLPKKQWPSVYLLPKHMMGGWAQAKLKMKYGTEADKLEALIFKKITRSMRENHLQFGSLIVTASDDLKNIDCIISNPSIMVHKSELDNFKMKPEHLKESRSGGYTRVDIKGQLKIIKTKPQLWKISGTEDLKYFKTTYGTPEDKTERLFFEEIAKSLKKSNIQFDGININVEPGLKWADCRMDGLTQRKEIESKKVWERIKGGFSIQNINRANWKISGYGDLEHIKIDINIEQILSSIPGSILEYRLVADIKPEQAKTIPCPKSGRNDYIWLPVSLAHISEPLDDNLPYQKLNDTVYLLVSNKPDQTMLADGSWFLEGTSITDYRSDKPAIQVHLNKKGKQKKKSLQKQRKNIIVCVDDQIISINNHVSFLITGDFTKDQVKSLAKLLLNGSHLKSKNVRETEHSSGEQ